MDLKRIEKLAKSKGSLEAKYCSYLMDFCKEEFEADYGNDYDFSTIKEWDELTGKEKERLIQQAMYYHSKDQNNAPMCVVCNCVMLNQKKIIDGTMDKWEFLNDLAWHLD